MKIKKNTAGLNNHFIHHFYNDYFTSLINNTKCINERDKNLQNWEIWPNEINLFFVD